MDNIVNDNVEIKNAGPDFDEKAKKANDMANLVLAICETQDMAEGAFRYQTWAVQQTLIWLANNGYEIKKKTGLIGLN